jgi:hypothetical protein
MFADILPLPISKISRYFSQYRSGKPPNEKTINQTSFIEFMQYSMIMCVRTWRVRYLIHHLRRQSRTGIALQTLQPTRYRPSVHKHAAISLSPHPPMLNLRLHTSRTVRLESSALLISSWYTTEPPLISHSQPWRGQIQAPTDSKKEFLADQEEMPLDKHELWFGGGHIGAEPGSKGASEMAWPEAGTVLEGDYWSLMGRLQHIP